MEQNRKKLSTTYRDLKTLLPQLELFFDNFQLWGLGLQATTDINLSIYAEVVTRVAGSLEAKGLPG